MCGRYYLDLEDREDELLDLIDEINRRHREYGEAAPMKSGEVRPTDLAPVISPHGAKAMRWGFPAAYKSGVVINARAETVAEKPMFRGALSARRLAVPINGFYEWRHYQKRIGEKYLFRVPGERTTYLAGLYAPFPTQDGGIDERFVILTAGANDSVAPYHDRMPLYLNRSEIDSWVTGREMSISFLSRAQPQWRASLAEENEQLNFFGLF